MGGMKIADSHRSDLNFSPTESFGCDLLNKKKSYNVQNKTPEKLGGGLSMDFELVPRPDRKDNKDTLLPVTDLIKEAM